MSPASYEQAVWSWTDHLRGGGSTRWRAWLETDHPGVPPADWTPPGAAQLEVVRRLAHRSGGSNPGFTALADVVLGRSGPGRGLAQQPLWWPDTEHAMGHRFGPPRVDPVDVPLDELVRLAVGTLTELVLSGPSPAPRHTSIRRLPLTRDPAFRLAGAPITAAAVRRDLGAAGHAEGGRSPRVVLLAVPFVEAMAQVWSARVQRGSALRWHGFLDTWAGRHQLPSSVDLPALARHWADRVGREQVHVVVGPAASAGASRAAAATLGVRLDRSSRRGRSLVSSYASLSPAAVDVARRVNGVLAVRATDDERVEAGRAVVDLLGRDPVVPATAGLSVATRHETWARERAARLVAELSAGGYSVRGHLEDLGECSPGQPTRPRLPAVLRCALGACLEQTAASARREVVT